MNLRELGSILLIAGTAIGAGMLALPMAAAPGGLFSAAILMIGICFLMTYASLMILEVNLMLPADKNSFSSMAETLFGWPGKIVCWVCYSLLLYAIISAYISGMGSLLSVLLEKGSVHLSPTTCSLLFTALLGSTLLIGTLVVDRVNQVFLYMKGFFLFTALFAMIPYVEAKTLFSFSTKASFWYQAIPIFTTSFSCAMVIPSIVNYMGKENYKSIRRVIIIGSTIPLVVYIFWIFVVFGVLPQTGDVSFAVIQQNNNDLGMMIRFIQENISTRWIVGMIDAFSNTAMTTSFLGVSLSLFDFLSDGFNIKKNKIGRLKTFFLTYIPPIIFAIFFPEGFMLALRYSAIFVSILLIIFPAALLWKKRRDHIKTDYRLPASPIAQVAVFATGVLFMICSFI
ncbi:MAG: amino acid permease [Chlamydiia bacterium]